MRDLVSRREITSTVGAAIDGVVAELYDDAMDGWSLAQEPEITSRICERVQERIDGETFGDYTIHVIAASMPDRGRSSIEKLTGADLIMSVSLRGPESFDKAIFVQAKYDRNVKKKELIDACERMSNVVGNDGIYVWVYEADGVKVLTKQQTTQMSGNSFEGVQRRSAAGLIGRILDCNAGSRSWGIPVVPNRRAILKERLQQVKAKHALDLLIEKRSCG